MSYINKQLYQYISLIYMNHETFDILLLCNNQTLLQINMHEICPLLNINI